MPEEKPQEQEDPQGAQFRPRDSEKGQSPERKGVEGHHGPDERHYSLSISEEERQHSFDIEDERWSRRNQIGDWLKLGFVVLIYLTVTYLIYLFEPGIR